MVKIIFLGTRGLIEKSNEQHRNHTAILYIYKGKKILIDYGETWLDSNKIRDIRPDEIII